MKLYTGMNRWGWNDWIGDLYPAGLSEKQFLSEYVKHFNAVQLNATHYKTYRPDEVKKWVEKADGRDFLFCPKVPQAISDYSSFKNIEDQTNPFLESLYAFGKHLGPVLFQVTGKFRPAKKDHFFSYLQSLPKDIQWFIQVGHPEWFEDNEFENLLKFCQDNNLGLVTNDAIAGLIKEKPPIQKCFARFSQPSDYKQLERWAEKLKQWEGKGLQEAYFFFEVGKDKQELMDYRYFTTLMNKIW